jgi:hypothetical protein
MATTREDWNASIKTRAPDPSLAVRTLFPTVGQGGSAPVLAEATDGLKWWVKAPNNPQGGRTCVAELLVSALGRQIGAPACLVVPILVPEALAGTQYGGGNPLIAGVGSASRHVEDAVEIRALSHLERDNNPRRLAGVVALYDWCWGSDEQWLYCFADDEKIYSHDHGQYLPQATAWTEQSLTDHLRAPHELATPREADSGELHRVADALQGTTQQALVSILESVPGVWPVSNLATGWIGTTCWGSKRVRPIR